MALTHRLAVLLGACMSSAALQAHTQSTPPALLTTFHPHLDTAGWDDVTQGEVVLTQELWEVVKKHLWEHT
jgi:hypothetical protein